MPKKPAKCEIRRAVATDGDALFELVEQFATSFRPRREAFEACLRGPEGDPSAWLSIAECGGQIIGYSLAFDHFAFFANGRVAWVEEIMVRSDWRRQRIGAQLMSAFEDWARSRGAGLAALATRRAAPFYVALGYDEFAAFFCKRL